MKSILNDRRPVLVAMVVAVAVLVVLALPSMAPPASPQPGPSDQIPIDDARTPRVGLALYHQRTGDMVLGFNVPSTLAQGWRQGISISAEGGPENVVLDGLGAGAHSIMGPDGSCIVMLSLDHADKQALLGSTAMTITIAAGTITGPGGATNSHTVLPIDIS